MNNQELSIESLNKNVDHVLDTSGLLCPEPVMLLHQKIRKMTEGQTVKIIATDPSTQRDIPKFCHFLNNELIAQFIEEELYLYFVRKN